MSNVEDWDASPGSDRGAGGGEASAQSELGRQAVAVLRRRWWLVAALAAVFAPAAGALGWKLGKVEFTSTATVHVRPMLQTVLYRDEEKGVLPMYDSYVNTQVELLRNRRVIDLAVQDPRWQKEYGPATTEAVAEFLQNVSVARRGELVNLSVSDGRASAAQAGTAAVIGAYRRIYLDQDTQQDEQRLTALQQLQTKFSAELKLVREQIVAAANNYGTEDLSPFYNARQIQVSQLEIELQKLKLDAPATQPATAVPADPASLTAQEAAEFDKKMADLLARRDDRARSLAILSETAGAANPTRIRAERELAALDREVEERLAQLRSAVVPGTRTPGRLTPAERITQLEQMLDGAKTDMLSLGRTQVTLNNLRLEEVRLREEIDRVRRRLDQLNVESATAGRLRVVSEGELPVVPTKDSRVRNAGIGGFGGLSLAVVLVVLTGLLDPRIRNLEDVRPRGGTGPVFGVLPEIPEGLEDPQLAAQAAHNVHHVRTMLEVWSNGKSPLTLSVTSPSSGSGKTSLTLALGVSFAAAGLRTLLVDLDMIGGGLTSRFDAMSRRRLGGLLVAQGVLTDLQRVEALREAARSGRKIGEVCVELGFASQAQVDSALAAQTLAPRKPGVIEALEGAALQECIDPTEIQNLFVLPLGNAQTAHAGAMSSQRVRRLLKRAGEEYDVVLVDSGPTPGSLEAGAAASAVDGVVLAVARGEDRSAVRQCSSHLNSIGATVAGIVFNRATGRETARISASRSSGFASAPRSTPRLALDPAVDSGLEASHDSKRMGPIAGAVATTVRGVRGEGQ